MGLSLCCAAALVSLWQKWICVSVSVASSGALLLADQEYIYSMSQPYKTHTWKHRISNGSPHTSGPEHQITEHLEFSENSTKYTVTIAVFCQCLWYSQFLIFTKVNDTLQISEVPALGESFIFQYAKPNIPAASTSLNSNLCFFCQVSHCQLIDFNPVCQGLEPVPKEETRMNVELTFVFSGLSEPSWQRTHGFQCAGSRFIMAQIRNPWFYFQISLNCYLTSSLKQNLWPQKNIPPQLISKPRSKVRGITMKTKNILFKAQMLSTGEI